MNRSDHIARLTAGGSLIFHSRLVQISFIVISKFQQDMTNTCKARRDSFTHVLFAEGHERCKIDARRRASPMQEG